MKPDKFAERLSKKPHELSPKQALIKACELINLYHSLEDRFGTPEQKSAARKAIRIEVNKLKPRVGQSFASNFEWFLADKQAWESVREGIY